MSTDYSSETWSQCALCSQIFSSDRRPTTLCCGHSICIDHMLKTSAPMTCPICNYSLMSTSVYHVSYALEEAVRIFGLIGLSKKASEIPKPIDKTGIRTKIDPLHEDYEEQIRQNEKLLDEMDLSSKKKKKR